MNSEKRKRILLISGAVILLCLTIIIGMSYALFSDTERVTNHLQAGNLNITLERTKLVSRYLTDQGFLDTKSNNTLKDFTDNKNENVFDITDSTLIVPGCEYIADLRITNNSKTAFSYWVEVVYKGEKDVDLASQIEVTIIRDNKVIGTLDKGLTSATINILAVGEYDDFTVGIKFKDLATNNSAMDDSLDFDLVVHAIQETQNPA